MMETAVEATKESLVEMSRDLVADQMDVHHNQVDGQCHSGRSGQVEQSVECILVLLHAQT